MELETLKVNPDFVGKVMYEKLEDRAPSTMFGKAGSYQRHGVFSEKHGVLNIITPTANTVYEEDKMYTVENPILFLDFVNGFDMAPARNIFAEKLVEVK